MTDKYFHVACVIKEGHLYDLLQSMEQHKIGNLEVRAVAPMLALPPPPKKKRVKKTERGAIKTAVNEAMKVGEPINVTELAKKLDVHPGSVNSAVQIMVNKKTAKKVSPGTFVRTRLDTQANGNGAHAS